MSSFEGISSPTGTKCARKKLKSRDYTLPYGEKPESLSHLGLIRYRDMTPGQTELR